MKRDEKGYFTRKSENGRWRGGRDLSRRMVKLAKMREIARNQASIDRIDRVWEDEASIGERGRTG
jgi:hypothetical protein